VPGGTAAGGNFTTSYTYSPLNQLLQVTMPRGGTTQYRTFSYNGQDMVSATNPENAAVSYTYDASHRALTRTDAKSQQTQYTYNTLGQLTQVLHGTISNGTFTSDPTSTVSYTYDTYGRLNTLTSRRFAVRHRDLHGSRPTVSAFLRRVNGDAHVQQHDAAHRAVGARVPEPDVQLLANAE
jgi:YD repeat-containing protein